MVTELRTRPVLLLGYVAAFVLGWMWGRASWGVAMTPAIYASSISTLLAGASMFLVPLVVYLLLFWLVLRVQASFAATGPAFCLALGLAAGLLAITPGIAFILALLLSLLIAFGLLRAPTKRGHAGIGAVVLSVVLASLAAVSGVFTLAAVTLVLGLVSFALLYLSTRTRRAVD